MLSGKPPRPWKRSRRRRVSVVRIVLLVLMLFAVGAFALWRMRPQTLPSHAVGIERMATPAFDVADETTRSALRTLSGIGGNEFQGEWLGWACRRDAAMAGEVYLLTRRGGGYRPGSEGTPVRIIAVLGADGGEIVREELAWTMDEVVLRQRRALDAHAAERFRDLLIEEHYFDLAPDGSLCTDVPVITMESCVRGRYFGAVGGCGMDPPSIGHVANAINAFARDGATSLPVLRPPPSATVGPDDIDSRGDHE